MSPRPGRARQFAGERWVPCSWLTGVRRFDLPGSSETNAKEAFSRQNLRRVFFWQLALDLGCLEAPTPTMPPTWMTS